MEILNVNVNLILVGVLNVDGQWVNLYCNPTNGDIVFQAAAFGDEPILLGELSITNPIDNPSVEMYIDELTSGRCGEGAIGLIYTTDPYKYVIKNDYTCTAYKITGTADTPVVIPAFDVTTDMVAEEYLSDLEALS